MRAFVGLLIAVVIGVFIGWANFGRGGKMPGGGGGGGGGTPAVCKPKEINVNKHGHKYSLELFHKNRHLSWSAHDSAVWTFDQDTTVDSVIVDFGGSSPFTLGGHWNIADSAGFSGPLKDSTGTFPYKITVYHHAAHSDTVDPGIIIDM